MAKTPAAARELLDEVWRRAPRARPQPSATPCRSIVAGEGGNFALAPWDWRYYAEKLRKARFDLDEARSSPIFQLDRMIEAAFETARRLFGLTFTPRRDVPLYHPDVRAWEVNGRDGAPRRPVHRRLFRARLQASRRLDDLAARPGEARPAKVTPDHPQRLNFSKPAAGEPALLSFDDARTLFHEFGHGLHGLLSNVTYPLLSGTAVPSDFVELPSQLYEHWLEVPEILQAYARHCRTGEPMPEALLDRLLGAAHLQPGLRDGRIHRLRAGRPRPACRRDPTALDVTDFERERLERIGMPAEIVMRHRPPHFQHLFSGGGYAAGYYSYMWSEVLDADAFEAFEETGDLSIRRSPKRLRDYIYSAGNLRDRPRPTKRFRGRLPTVDALLKKRGLADVIV